MQQDEFLVSLVERLAACGIPYMTAGSFGSAFHGEPRATNDVDIVIDPTAEQIEEFLGRLDPNYYVDRKTAVDAVARRSMFNVIDTLSGWKADLIIRKSRPFSREEFSRRATTDVAGHEVFILSPEDAILSKLEWAKKGDSERQLKDVETILREQRGKLDIDYLQKWARELAVDGQLNELLERQSN